MGFGIWVFVFAEGFGLLDLDFRVLVCDVFLNVALLMDVDGDGDLHVEEIVFV